MNGYDSGLIWATIGGMFVFGFVYNLLVCWLERHNYDEGYTSLLVVGGVGVTLGGMALIDWRAALLGLGLFAASGFWMVVGSVARYVRRRQRAQEAFREIRGLGGDDGSETVAE